MRYEFPNLRLLKRLTLDVETRDGRLVVRVGGMLAPLFRRAFSRWFDVYNHIRPVGSVNGSNVYTLYVPPIPSRMHARHAEHLVRRWLFGTRIPLAVTIGVTDRCQCVCAHCSAMGGHRSGPPLSLDDLRRVIGQSVELGVTNVTFTGGEPLLRPDLDAIVAMVPSDQAVSLVFTNGIGLTAARARQLKDAGLWGVQISLDSPDPEEHDRLRGWAGCFRAVTDGVASARDAGLFVGLSTYATNESVRSGTLRRIADLGASWGACELTVFDAIPTGRLRNQTSTLLTPESRERLVREGVELREAYRGRMHVVTQSWTNSRSGFARFIGCLAGHYQFHVTAAGDVRPCDFTPLSIGSVRESSVADLWKRLTSHPAYRSHRHECRMQSPSFREKYIDA
jgi:MoaA/NifB/PqqE/SkfB family radical SAM enzyme